MAPRTTAVFLILLIFSRVSSAQPRLSTSFLAVNPASGETLLAYDPAGLLSTPLPTGSLIKVFTLISALRQDPSLARLSVLCGKTSASRDPFDGCWYLPGHGKVGMSEALAYSCNRYFRVLGEKVNPAVFWTTLVEFGLISPSQAARCLRWTARDTVEAMIGLSARLLVKPRSMLYAYCCLVNGGFLFQPGEVTTRVRFVPLEQSALHTVSEGMFGCCAYGSGANAFLSPADSVAGKTGTAAYCLSGKVVAGKTHGLFIGFVPAGDQPHTGIIVFSPEGTGSKAAVTAEPILSVFSLLRNRHPSLAGEQVESKDIRTVQ